MISTAKIISMFIPIVFSVALFVGFIIFYKRKTGISAKPLLLGAVGFIVFTQFLEQVLHAIVITNFPNYADHPWLFGLYGGLAAGIFEEVGRFILFVWLLKKYRKYKDGISFGVGWAGIEAIIITFTLAIPLIIFSFSINAGTFESTIGQQLPEEQVAQIKEMIYTQGTAYYILACVERFFAMCMQIALSLIVLHAVVKQKFIYVLYAILIHAAIDFPIVFYQTGYITNIWIVELYIALIGIAAIVYIKRAKSNFEGYEGYDHV
ncbi:YhfC family intramembrane metalloprotease [Virgibacillus sp. W0430]|uniref:YhfC family intramembrane metalloprotease n=1 Tax=Virgibacillus sp. W0430 TaxID=3391580 RepID=UPI003F47DD5E